MNDAIRAKMAEAEGWTMVQSGGASTMYWRSPEKYTWREQKDAPAYDNDNDLDRFIRGMGRRHLIKYRVALYHVTKPTGQQVADNTDLRMIVATVEQKQAAIIKAMGWEGVDYA